MRKQGGITLVALVITIIILIILAGIAISLALGDNGLINKTKTGAERYKDEALKEQNTLEDVNLFLNGSITAVGAQEDNNKLYIIQNGITTNEFQTSSMEKLNINTNLNDYSVVAQTDNIQYNRAAITFRNIDFTDYSKIGIDYKVNNKTGDTTFSLLTFQNNANVNTDNYLDSYARLLTESEYSKARTTDYIENLPSGTYALSVLKNSTLSNTKVEYNIYNLWLEKSNAQKDFLIENGTIKKTYETLNASILNESSIPNIFGLTNSINSRAGIYLNNQNIEGYSKIGIDYEVENKTGNSIFYFALFKNNENMLVDTPVDQTILVTDSEYSKQRTTDYLEISDDGEYILSLYKNATSGNTQVKFKIYNLWYEK